MDAPEGEGQQGEQGEEEGAGVDVLHGLSLAQALEQFLHFPHPSDAVPLPICGAGQRDPPEAVDSSPYVVFQFGSGRVMLPLHKAAKQGLGFQIWRSSLVAAARLAGQPTVHESTDTSGALQAASLSGQVLNECCVGKEVLELGCGCGLAGLVAGRLGASRVVLTDCKDEVLAELQRMVSLPVSASSSLTDHAGAASACTYEVRHLLWQQDALALAHLAGTHPAFDSDSGDPTFDSDSGDPTSDDPSSVLDLPPELACSPPPPPGSALTEAQQQRRQRACRLMGEAKLLPPSPHWSDATRDAAIPVLSPCQQFDLVLASDCLYFSGDEAGLVASLLLRTRRPTGCALVTFQPRNNNGACIGRVADALRAAGLHVLREAGPWCMERMVEAHLRGVAGVGGRSQREMSVTRTAAEDGELELLTVSWRPLLLAVSPLAALRCDWARG